MAELTPQERLQPSLLDRLTDENPARREESREQRVISAARLRECVVRDLSWLFNCTHAQADQDFSSAPQVADSVINFGIPDLAGTALSGVDVAQLERQLRAAILAFEPRLLPGTLSINIHADTRQMDRKSLLFDIESEMWAQPMPLNLYLKTEVDLETGDLVEHEVEPEVDDGREAARQGEPQQLSLQAQHRRRGDFGHRGKLTCTTMQDGGVQDLLEAWAELITRHSADAAAVETGRALLAAWAEPHRRYHSVTHLRDVLDSVELLADHAEDADAVRLAAWYHDSVYNGRPDDEELSACRAETELAGLDADAAFVAEVARLVRMTAAHNPEPGDHNAEVLSDADLASLAIDGERYRRNSADIRLEFAHVDEHLFRAGRAAIIAALLAGPSLYRTRVGRQRWEDAARANLKAELDALTGP